MNAYSIVPILDSKCTFCGSRPISSFASRNAVRTSSLSPHRSFYHPGNKLRIPTMSARPLSPRPKPRPPKRRCIPNRPPPLPSRHSTTTIAANSTATTTAENGRIYHHDTRRGENDGDVEIYVGIIMQKIFLSFEFFCTTVQKISFGVQKKTIDLEFVVVRKYEF